MAGPLEDGSTDLYIKQKLYREQFAADLTAEDAALNAAAQRPLRDVALNEASAAWKDIPSWFVFPEQDKNIPFAAHRFMAERAGSRRTVEVPGASHSLPVSRPDAVVDVILDAIKDVT